MMAFKFRLQRVLQLKNSHLRVEEFKLEHLLHLWAQIQAEMEAADLAVRNARKSIESATFSNSTELAAFERFRTHAERDRHEMLRKLAAHEESIKKQRDVIVAARRGVVLLEKLREKRRIDWQAEADREAEALSADLYAAQWLRSQR